MINLSNVEEDRKKNFEQRLRYVEEYAEWVKDTPNEIWSKQQKDMIDSVLKSSDKIKKEGIEIKTEKI